MHWMSGRHFSSLVLATWPYVQRPLLCIAFSVSCQWRCCKSSCRISSSLHVLNQQDSQYTVHIQVCALLECGHTILVFLIAKMFRHCTCLHHSQTQHGWMWCSTLHQSVLLSCADLYGQVLVHNECIISCFIHGMCFTVLSCGKSVLQRAVCVIVHFLAFGPVLLC